MQTIHKNRARSKAGFWQMSGNTVWSEWRDLNPRPSLPESDALPGCATLRLVIVSTSSQRIVGPGTL